MTKAYTGLKMKELKKLQLNAWPLFIQKIVDLTKEGKEIDLTHTRGMYGRYYVVAYYDEVVEQELQQEDEDTPVLVSDEDTVEFSTDEPHTAESLKGKTVEELRAILDGMDRKYHPAHKEAKLIELVLAAE